ncbi:TetR/AcrR family transcriptional regulator [Alkaliphilus transvaalensis]|uniref:TetR/AcrR family transcriptional regulator n=1 Tax=Alkaliphilus transvaalensis TaxID=114628 RepID=UPI00047AF035|nr:TetR/AcrR family transcriptional regulator [Alkaliphilus transvaalensis]
MPKQTFFNLPQEKKENLITAAKKEFSRVPLYKASISNIIKTAEIPRGSFYQYFEDLEDLFLFVLSDSSMDIRQQLIYGLKEFNGDLFCAFEEMFKHLLMCFKDKGNADFFKNTFLNMNHRIEKTFTPNICKEKAMEQRREFLSLVDLSKLNINSKEEVPYVLQIMMAITMHNLIQIFAKNLSFEEAIKIYKIEIDMIKKGISSENNRHSNN